MKKFRLLAIAVIAVFSLNSCDDSKSSLDSGYATGYYLTANGGNGASGNGGNAGNLQIQSYSDLRVLRSGSVNASFSVPGISENLGEVPLVIRRDTTLEVPLGDPGAGVPYLFASDNYIRISDGDGIPGNDDIVTGLKVSGGATLTLNPNNGSTTISSIYLEKDVVVLGRIETVFQPSPSERDRVHLNVTSEGQFYCGSGSFITLTGADATSPADNGGIGGLLQVTALDNITIRGRIDTSGGDGVAGGAAPPVVLMSVYRNIYTTNEITMNGGNGTTGQGGSSNAYQTDASFGNVMNRAVISMNGGDSVDGNGGNGGSFIVTAGAGSIGSFYNSSAISASGGSSENANGGSASTFMVNAHGDDILWSGSLNARGGDGVVGGNGANIGITSATGTSIVSGTTYAYGTIRIGATIALDGGNGTTDGGDGGNINIVTSGPVPDIIPPSNTVELVGYRSLSFNGGDGGNNGGNGASTVLLRTLGFPMITGEYWNAGAITSEADINADGGNGVTGSGGTGGFIQLNSQNAEAEEAVFANTGDITAAGGSGDSGGNSGLVEFYSFREMKNTGDITVTGGDATGNAVSAGVGSPGTTQMMVIGYGDLVNRGDIHASGGDATGTNSAGGPVGTVHLWAADVLYNYGRVYANGGASTNGTSSSGGAVEFRSGLVGETVNSASIITVEGGAGATPPTTGSIVIDLIDVTPADGTLP